MSVYVPLKSAAKNTRDYTMPGEHAVKFTVSEKGFKPSDYGLEVNCNVKVVGTPYQFFERFILPENDEKAHQLMHMVSERTGKEYKDPSYMKWCNLQAVAGFQGGEAVSQEDIMDFLNEVEVSWGVNLEVSVNSKDADNWDDVVDWFESNLSKNGKPRGWSQREYDGADIITWHIGKVDETNQPLLDHVSGIPGVTFKNVLNGFNKPKKV